MAMATAMSQRPTPQQTSSNPKPPPPPPPRGRTLVGVKRAAPKEENNRIVKVAKTKKGNGVGPPPPPPNTNRVSRVRKPPPPPPPSGRLPKREMTRRVTMRKPTVLRDVECYTKQYKVGQGTYGSVFVGEDKKTKEIVALKRINTEMEENGFPITALREVKILKALNHENVIKLKEIVTSKGENMF